MKSSYNSHVKRIILGLIAAGALGLAVRSLLIPDSFGLYGHYRADAIQEEANREIRHGTISSCVSCHPHEAGLQAVGVHKTVSCEFCHGTYADHIQGGKDVKALPVKKKEEITVLCLRCHNQAILARPHEVIKMITMPAHLEEKKVKTSHTCDQCHYPHAPLLYIDRAKEMLRLGGEI